MEPFTQLYKIQVKIKNVWMDDPDFLFKKFSSPVEAIKAAMKNYNPEKNIRVVKDD